MRKSSSESSKSCFQSMMLCSLDVSGARGDETALGFIVNQTVKISKRCVVFKENLCTKD